MDGSADFIKDRVRCYYWEEDLNCATTVLKILGEFFEVEINPQVFAAATGMHGAGKFGAQCGLVEGALMFIGIIGQARNVPEKEIVQACYDFACSFQETFTSLLCKELRPEGFRPGNPPHLCEGLTNKAVDFALNYMQERMSGGVWCGDS